MKLNNTNRLVVLNTRPQKQARTLSEALKKIGVTVIEQPTLEICPLSNSTSIQKTLSKLPQYHFVIFISSHAVNAVAPHWQPSSATLIAVGPTTLATIQETLSATAIAPSTYSSQGMLSMTELQHINQQHILIIGSDYKNAELTHTLQSRGATVDTLVSYRVAAPTIKPHFALKQLKRSNVDLIIITSQASLRQLTDWFMPLDANWLLSRHLLTISENIYRAALDQGWTNKNTSLSENATTNAIVKTIRSCYH